LAQQPLVVICAGAIFLNVGPDRPARLAGLDRRRLSRRLRPPATLASLLLPH